MDNVIDFKDIEVNLIFDKWTNIYLNKIKKLQDQNLELTEENATLRRIETINEFEISKLEREKNLTKAECAELLKFSEKVLKEPAIRNSYIKEFEEIKKDKGIKLLERIHKLELELSKYKDAIK